MFVDLPETLRDTCSVVTELETDNAHGAKALRVRMDLIRTATMFLSSRPRPDEQVETLALARLVSELREEAVALRRRHRVVKRMVLSMMD